MRYISVFAVLAVLLIAIFPAYAADVNAANVNAADVNEERRDAVVGLFGALATPSIFTPASSEHLGILLYGRTLTGEGQVPDFDGEHEEEIDALQIFASGRIGGLGLTIGFGTGDKFDFSKPFIVSVDYKVGLMEDTPMLDAAVDVQYTTIFLTDEDNIGTTALGFGVFSVTGLLSAKLLFLAEPYAGLTLNYVYLNSDAADDFIGVWKLIPKIGLHVKFLPITVGTEIKFLRNKHLKSAWMWDFGAGIRF